MTHFIKKLLKKKKTKKLSINIKKYYFIKKKLNLFIKIHRWEQVMLF